MSAFEARARSGKRDAAVFGLQTFSSCIYIYLVDCFDWTAWPCVPLTEGRLGGLFCSFGATLQRRLRHSPSRPTTKRAMQPQEKERAMRECGSPVVEHDWRSAGWQLAVEEGVGVWRRHCWFLSRKSTGCSGSTADGSEAGCKV